MLEAGFLILLAVVVGFADLGPALIILVMAVAWLLIAMIEYFAWRQGPRLAGARPDTAAAEPAAPPPPVHEEVVEEAPPPDEETMVGSTPPSEEEPERPAEFLAAPPERARYSLEPLQPRPRRRWVVFGPRERSEAPPEGTSEEER